jgi:hypothetical protein
MMRLLLVAGIVLLLVPQALAQEPPPVDSPEEPPPITAPPQSPYPQVPQTPAARPAPAPAPAPANPGPHGGEEMPAVRAEAGNIGMYFRFGGLASLAHSNNTRTIGPLVFTQVGMKFVFSETWMLPVYFGTGLRVDSPDEGDSATNWGIDLGAGFEYHFRIWRRISPFLGVSLGINMEDPTMEDNLRFGFGVGPSLGVEYYIADRLSVTAMYMFVIQLNYQDDPANSVTTFSMQTLAGGALNITYYF